MKLIQINAYEGRLDATLRKFLANEQPDLVTAQEIFNSENDVPVPYGMFNLGSRLRDTLNLKFAYFSPRYSVDVAGEEMIYGNLILSRWPFSRTETTPIFGEPYWHVKIGNPINNVAIILQTVKIATPSGELALANYHGYVTKTATGYLGSSESTSCMEKVAKKFNDFADLPLIFSGDFNVAAESESMRVFDGKFRDLTAENNIAKTLSPAHWWNGPAACDHILVNSRIEVKSFAMPEVLVSDHFPLVMEFEI